MRVLFAAASLKVVAGILAAGAVITEPSPPPAMPTWYFVVLLVSFQLTGSWLFIGGRRDVRAQYLATVFVLFATIFTDRILIRTAARAPGGLALALLAIASVRLVAFCPFALWRFVTLFPRAHPVGRSWIGPLMDKATLLTGAVLVAGNIMLAFPGSDRPQLAAALAWTSVQVGGLFWPSLAILSLSCLWLLLVKWRRAEMADMHI